MFFMDSRDSRKNKSISFEVYPPNTLQGFRNLYDTCQQLNALSPDFVSVTFGAAGASQLKTERVVRQLRGRGISTAPHLSCVNMTKDRLNQLLDKYKGLGVKRLVVIRGDFPDNRTSDSEDFRYASELIEFIRNVSGDYFHISVAAYPEFHAECPCSTQDLINFKNKIAAGANSAITQFCFNSDAYFRFNDSCQALGIMTPIIPGIMPIQDYARLMRIAKLCGAEIPLWLQKRLESLAKDDYSFKQFGIDVITRLCEQLLVGGAPGLHFYALNQVTPVQTIYNNLFVIEENTVRLREAYN